MTDLNTYITDRIGYYAPGREDGGTATLQTIRRRDYANLKPHDVLIIIGQALTYLHTRRGAMEVKAIRLQALQPVQAAPHYRKDRQGKPRYLYLIHSTQDDGSRQREYIGTNPTRQEQAIERINAYQDLVKVETEIQEIDRRLAAITGHLARALIAATIGLAPQW